MTEKELNRLDWLRRRRDVLQAEKAQAQRMLRSFAVTSVVRGSRTEEPYNLHPIVVKGLPDSKEVRAATAEYAEAVAGLRMVEEEIRLLEEYIRNVQDPIARDVMTRHWIRGESWISISTKMGKGESWARMVVARYMSKKY